MEAGAWGAAGLLLLGAPARAQRREDWSEDGPLDGREPSDPERMTPEERAHVPVLVMPRQPRVGRPFDLVVRVGLETHAMAPHHRIDWIEVAAGSERIFVSDLGPRVAFPVVRVPVVLSESTTLTVRARCNRHGVWRTRREVTVR